MGDALKSTQVKATLAGFAAIIMWALLALLTDFSGDIPPFQLAAMTFFLGTLVGVIWSMLSGATGNRQSFRPSVALLGGLGLFAYHALYFAALKNAPAAEASLIAYLWPLLIVVGSAMLPGEKLKAHHVLGALSGFIGSFVIISGGRGFDVQGQYVFGYGLAFVAAFTWAGYSLVSRRFSKVPSSIVVYYCGISTVLSLIAHFIFETTIIPNDLGPWLAVVGLGVLPVGAAFYVWDYGMKHGHIQIVGAASYAAPLFSTVLLVIFGRAELAWPIGLACLLITVGALIAAKDLLKRKS